MRSNRIKINKNEPAQTSYHAHHTPVHSQHLFVRTTAIQWLIFEFCVLIWMCLHLHWADGPTCYLLLKQKKLKKKLRSVFFWPSVWWLWIYVWLYLFCSVGIENGFLVTKFNWIFGKLLYYFAERSNSTWIMCLRYLLEICPVCWPCYRYQAYWIYWYLQRGPAFLVQRTNDICKQYSIWWRGMNANWLRDPCKLSWAGLLRFSNKKFN